MRPLPLEQISTIICIFQFTAYYATVELAFRDRLIYKLFVHGFVYLQSASKNPLSSNWKYLEQYLSKLWQNPGVTPACFINPHVIIPSNLNILLIFYYYLMNFKV